MRMFMKAQTASLFAWLVDLAVMKFGVYMGIWYIWASVLGNIMGAITHFTLGRGWVFQRASSTLDRHIIRYAIVWCGYVVLTSCVLFVFTDYMQIDAFWSKILTSVLISVGYNYPLQKRFVFK